MFETLLIANRGEIACRIMETAQAMGLRCVAVYSDADRAAKHVLMADEAVWIGGSAPFESYLDGEKIIVAAKQTGAQAIHPGYGFLSENPDFVDAVAQAGLTFVGPSSAAIRAMGLKGSAKALMADAGVPVVPGYHGAQQEAAFLAGQAAEIGYPVLIKAVAGGGGKGMRLVERPEAFDAALASARSEALGAFGNSDVLIEKFVQSPRHIEVQVFGDGTDAVHLFERDCSLQRRHQKVIEEAPAPGMTPQMRQAMGEAAVKAAKAIGYSGAGTVEFIVDGSGSLRADRFWFMEMNTRLQVEHPVTELITGVDLVAWQLRVAGGEPLPMAQDQISLQGHSFEARLYAEDVPAGFLPATGRLAHLAFPEGCRADSGVRSGDEITPFYDPMIAKVITYGDTRAVALQNMRHALAETQVAGTKTNLAFLHALASHEGFTKGEVDTGLIARDLDTLVAEQTLNESFVAEAVFHALKSHIVCASGFHLWQPLTHRVVLRQDDEDYVCKLTFHSATEIDIAVNDKVYHLTSRDGAWWIGGRKIAAGHVSDGEITIFTMPALAFEHVDPLDQCEDSKGTGNDIIAPMPGLVKLVDVTPGTEVRQGERLAILEAMKMEHSLLASRDGKVFDVHVAQGQQVTAGEVLIQLEEESQ